MLQSNEQTKQWDLKLNLLDKSSWFTHYPLLWLSTLSYVQTHMLSTNRIDTQKCWTHSHETTDKDFLHPPRIDKICWEVSCAHPLVCVFMQAYVCVCVKLSPLSVSNSVNRRLFRRELRDGAWSRKPADWHWVYRKILTLFKRLSSCLVSLTVSIWLSLG